MGQIAVRFGLIVTVAALAAANVVAQEEPSPAGRDLEGNAGGEEGAVKQVVDGIMQPYLAQRQRMEGGHRWIRSPHLGMIVAVSLHGHRYFFPYGSYCAGIALFSLRRRNSIAQSAAIVRISLITCVVRTLLKVAGVSVGSSNSRTCFEGAAAAAPESNCLIASSVAKRCAVVSFIASRLL